MPHLHTFLLCLLWLLSATSARASDTTDRLRTFTSAEGLSDNAALCALRDRHGFVWIGTAGGLNCFDGTSNTVLRNFADNSRGLYGSDIVYSLLALDNDDLMVGGSVGIHIYHRATNTFSPLTAATRYGVVVSSAVRQLMAARSGQIWICTMGQGVFVYDKARHTLVQHSRHGGFASGVCQRADGSVCVAMIDGSVNIFSPDGRFRSTLRLPGYVSAKAGLCIQAMGNDVYVGAPDALYHMARGSVRALPLPAMAGGVTALTPTGPGTLAVGTRHGLYHFLTSTQQFARVDSQPGLQALAGQTVNGLLFDHEHILWVLTALGGVCWLPPHQGLFAFHPLPEEGARASRRMVYAFCPAGGGNVFVGGRGGLYLYNAATRQTSLYRGGLVTHTVRDLMSDGHYLWVGTATDGVRRVNLRNGQTQSFTYSDSRPYTLPGNEVRCIYRSSKGQVFIATNWGLCRYDAQGQRFMTYNQLPSMCEFVDMADDGRGHLWAATNGNGLYRLDERSGQWRVYTHDRANPRSIPANAQTAVVCDRHAQVWVAVSGAGLYRYDASADGFLRIADIDANIRFLSTDRHDHLWVATQKGLFRVNTQGRHTATMMQCPPDVYGASLMPRAARCTAQGEMYIGSAEGFHSFRSALARVATPAPAYVTGLSLPYAARQDEELERLRLNRPLYADNQVRLPYRDNSFTLHFSSPLFTSTPSPRFDYFLEGIDRQWIHGSPTAYATYANVPPGRYVMRLRLSGHEGPVSCLYITVLPPWYRTVWAYLVYALALAALAFYAWRRAKRAIRTRYERHLERYRTEQEKRAYQSKITFFVRLVHEIRTPLSLIVLPLERMASLHTSPDDKRYLSVIQRNVRYLLTMTSQLLDFQKMEDGRMHLHMANISMRAVASEAYQQWAAYCDVEGKRLDMTAPDDTLTTGADRGAIDKIVMNLMSNALKHARHNVALRLEGDRAKKLISFSVTDDGPGVSDADKEHIFEAFYQSATDPAALTQGTGIGLSYAKALAVAHGGDLVVTDATPHGARFTLLLPWRKVEDGERHTGEALPVTDTQDSTPDDAHTSGTEKDGSVAPPPRRTILLVEDNAELLAMTGDMLRQWYRVLRAANGADALDKMRHHDIDIVVSDVMMPVMDGVTLCQRVKADINTSHIPVVLLTAKTTLQAKVEGMRSGADVYLEKPFAMEQLHRQIDNLLLLRQRFHQRMRQAEGDIDSHSLPDCGVNQQDMAFLQKVQQTFNNHLADDHYNIDLMAADMSMSRSSFYRKLKALTAMPPADFMRTQRMKRACAMLTSGSGIAEAAEKTGFSSPSYFAKCFKQTYGKLPKEFVAEGKRKDSEMEEEKEKEKEKDRKTERQKN